MIYALFYIYLQPNMEYIRGMDIRQTSITQAHTHSLYRINGVENT